MTAYSVEEGLNATVQHVLDELSGDEADVFYTLSLGPLAHWNAESESWLVHHSILLTIQVTYNDKPDEAYQAHYSMALCGSGLDGDVDDFEHAIKRMWDQVQFMRLCGGSEFNQTMDQVASEIEGTD